MQPAPAIAILDIGKTNKKILVFDCYYNILSEDSIHLEESVDEDGDPCENILHLTDWIRESFRRVLASRDWDLKAVNVSAYGASFVHLGQNGEPVAPLYNYLKPLQADVAAAFHGTYADVPTSTASPDLGNLNSGIQLYMIRKTKPTLFKRITASLHLPQYGAYVLNGRQYSDMTSIGCHTALWDFTASDYHRWVDAEGLRSRLAPVMPSETAIELKQSNKIIYSGIGLHDSSAALIPYLATTTEPFCLISTGTWCITLNPFNNEPLTSTELAHDCLCYISFKGSPVKAARLFSGHFHDHQVKAISEYFNPEGREDFYKKLELPHLRRYLGQHRVRNLTAPFEPFNVSEFSNCEAAYAYLIEELVARQVRSTKLVLGNRVKRIYVDGGFSTNPLFMTLLSQSLPDYVVSAATVTKASALGAALAIHKSWNKVEINKDILRLKILDRNGD
jgi:sugar (pentulose or hexulose) kinase